MSDATTTTTIATAGWAIPRTSAGRFPAEGVGLSRYAARFDGVEINTTFYRSHRASTLGRWAEVTPDHFRFAVKAPKAITHEARLQRAGPLLAAFRTEVEPLGAKLGPLLVQLPPSLAYDGAVAEAFFSELRGLWNGGVVCEPRHPSWFEAAADALLARHEVGRVAADPARHPRAATPGGWPGLAYWRLHGSPHMYRSSYDGAQLARLAAAMRQSPAAEVWCVFDNTTSGAAATNALDLQAMFGDDA